MRAILTYHSIDDSGSPISVSPEVFRAHCAFLASGRVRVLPLLELMRERDSGVDAVAITFDDGFENTGTIAWPMLAAHGLPATVFVVPGHVGKFNDWGGRRAPGIPHLPLLSWDALGSLVIQHGTLGAHTMTHANLAGLGAAAVDDELDRGHEAMVQHAGTAPTTFAYPYGGTSPVAARAVRARYELAVTTELRPLRSNEDAALLPRLDMYYVRSPGALEAWGQPSFHARLWTRRLGRQARAWLHPSAGRVA